MEDTNRCYSNRSSTSVMLLCGTRWITGLMEFPQRLDVRMHAFGAVQHFPTDTGVGDHPVTNDGSGNSERPLSVIRRFADAPLPLQIAFVSRNDVARRAFETGNALRIPTEDVFAR